MSDSNLGYGVDDYGRSPYGSADPRREEIREIVDLLVDELEERFNLDR